MTYIILNTFPDGIFIENNLPFNPDMYSSCDALGSSAKAPVDCITIFCVKQGDDKMDTRGIIPGQVRDFKKSIVLIL